MQEGSMTVNLEPIAKNHAGSTNARLLRCRMAALGLDGDALARTDRDTLEKLAQRCAGCEFPEGCADDLRDDPSSPVWEAYCPNSAVLTWLCGA